jgi:hypothetical protein
VSGSVAGLYIRASRISFESAWFSQRWQIEFGPPVASWSAERREKGGFYAEFPLLKRGPRSTWASVRSIIPRVTFLWQSARYLRYLSIFALPAMGFRHWPPQYLANKAWLLGMGNLPLFWASLPALPESCPVLPDAAAVYPMAVGGHLQGLAMVDRDSGST